MRTARGRNRGIAALTGIILVGMIGLAESRAADPGPPPDDAYLDGLQGSWEMMGTVLGKPVRYSATGHRVLQGGFLRLRMVDLERPPGYEADVYIGFDQKAGDYVAHWLDRFGAAGARVVARGERRGQQLILMFPYADGAFRDTFTWQPASGSWSLLLESQGTGGEWSTFASYTLTRTTPH